MKTHLIRKLTPKILLALLSQPAALSPFSPATTTTTEPHPKYSRCFCAFVHINPAETTPCHWPSHVSK